jgi:hypothetical protein
MKVFQRFRMIGPDLGISAIHAYIERPPFRFLQTDHTFAATVDDEIGVVAVGFRGACGEIPYRKMGGNVGGVETASGNPGGVMREGGPMRASLAMRDWTRVWNPVAL